LAWLVGLTAAAVLLAWAGWALMPWDKLFPDFICYWSAGELLASGRSPYDIALQTQLQQGHGWDKATDGLGIYDFLPYYYPPWFGLLWVPLLPLGYAAGKVAWFFLNVEFSLVTGYLLKQNVPEVRAWMPLVMVPVFFFSLVCMVLGQTALLVFFLIALAWWLLNQDRDRSAGVVLAWLTIKPQVAAVLLLAILLWAIRRHRWAVVWAFLITVTLLCALSACIVPSWPAQMWNAQRQTPPPTVYYPWIGNTWFLLLRTLGLEGAGLWALYLVAAVPFLAVVVRAAWDRATRLSDLFALGVLSAFFIAPYGRHYDFPVLLIPALVLLARRLPDWAGAALLFTLVVVPYLQLFALAEVKGFYNPSGKFLVEGTYFWVPLLLTAAWWATVKEGSGPRTASGIDGKGAREDRPA
jgi:hypothetical protein